MRSQIVIACVVVLLGCAASSSAQTVSLRFVNENTKFARTPLLRVYYKYYIR